MKEVTCLDEMGIGAARCGSAGLGRVSQNDVRYHSIVSVLYRVHGKPQIKMTPMRHAGETPICICQTSAELVEKKHILCTETLKLLK